MAALNPFAEPAAAEAAIDDTSFHSELAGGQPSAPVSTSLPPEETAWLGDEPLPIPEAPASETAAAAGPVSMSLPADQSLLKPAKIGGLVMDFASAPPPEPFEPSTGITQTDLPAVTVGETKHTLSDAEVQRRVKRERAERLSNRIDEVYKQITDGVVSDVRQARNAMEYLRIARDKELEDPRQFDEAEYLVNAAHYTVTRARQVQDWSYSYGLIVLIYGVVWLAIFLGGLVFDPLILNWFRSFAAVPEGATSMTAVFAPYATVMAGGIGGILSLLYSLYKHVAQERDFDRQFVMWYILQPFMGIVAGYLVHLFIIGGLFQAFGATSDAFEFVGLALAAAAAFRPHYLYGWIESLLKAIRPGGREPTPQEAQSQAGVSLSEAELRKLSGPAPTAAPAQPEPSAASEPAGVG